MSYLRRPVHFVTPDPDPSKPKSVTVAVAYSWVQKALRKGDPTAYYIAELMVRSGHTGALFKRLRVATVEDHIGNMMLPQLMDDLTTKVQGCLNQEKKLSKSIFTTDGKKISPPMSNQSLILILKCTHQAIAALLVAPKTRILNCMLTFVRKQLWEDNRGHPYLSASDALQQMKQSVVSTDTATKSYLHHLRLVMIMLIWGDSKVLKDLWVWLMARTSTPHIVKSMKILHKWYRDGVNDSLTLAAALLFLHPEGVDPIQYPQVQFQCETVSLASPAVANELKMQPWLQVSCLNHFFSVPDYTYDKHTLQGSQKGRGTAQFFDEGAQVINKLFDDPFEQSTRDWYIALEHQHAQHPSKTPRAKSADIMASIKRKWTQMNHSDVDPNVDDVKSLADADVSMGVDAPVKRGRKRKSSASANNDDNDETEEKHVKKKHRSESQPSAIFSHFHSRLYQLQQTYPIPWSKVLSTVDMSQHTVVVDQDPFSCLDQSILTQIPTKPPVKAMVGIWNHPCPDKCDIFNGQRVFLKGPFVSDSAQLRIHRQLWFNRAKSQLDMDNLMAYVIQYGFSYYLLMPDISTLTVQETKSVSSKRKKNPDQEIKRYLISTPLKSGDPSQIIRASHHLEDYFELVAPLLMDDPVMRQQVELKILKGVCFRHLMGIGDHVGRNFMVVIPIGPQVSFQCG